MDNPQKTDLKPPTTQPGPDPKKPPQGIEDPTKQNQKPTQTPDKTQEPEKKSA